MKKLKLYLDTSVISHLEQPNKQSEYEYTHEFWNDVKNGIYEIYVSRPVFDEFDKCDEQKRVKLYNYLAEVQYNYIERNEEITNLTKEIIKQGVLPVKSVLDSEHIASAIVSGCDYVLSWNMKHIVNIKTNNGIRIITIKENYPNIQLVPPSMFIYGGDTNA